MRVSCVAVLAVCLAAPISAQEVRATLSGTVTDPSGVPVPGAKMSARNTSTNLTVTTITTVAGSYTLPQLPPGPYELTAELEGFRKYGRTGITLAVADKATVDVRLEVGSVNESVTVTAALAGIETNQSVSGQLLDNKKVVDLPLNGRSFIMLLQLSAGVVFTTKVGPNSGWDGTRVWENAPYAGPFTVHGGKSNTSAFLVDGGALGIEGGVTWIPMTDAIEEVKVSTPISDASLGLSGGGVINVVMKSGTNEYHGLLSEFLRNNATDGLQTQIRRTGGTSTKHQWNTFSGLFSGPFIKNKFFFSGGYDGFREREPLSAVQTVPTALQRNGDFSQTLNGAGQMIMIYDPLSTRQVGTGYVRDPFPGNKLPVDRINPVASNYLPFWPNPNTAGDPLTNTRNYVVSQTGIFGNDAWHVKSQYLWNEKHRTSVTMTQNWGYKFGNKIGLPYNSPAANESDPFVRVHQGAVVDHIWTLSPTMVIDARASWDRWAEISRQYAAEQFDGSKLGFKGPVSPYGTHFVNVAVSGMLPLGYPGRSARPNNNYTGVVDVSKTIGHHLVKFGVRLIESRNNFLNLANSLGSFSFTGDFTQRNPQLVEPDSGYPFATFMLGYPGSGGVTSSDSIAAVTHTYGSYIQDDFRVTKKLTLNFGLRWDVQTPPVERYNRGVQTFDPNASYALNGAPVQGGLVYLNKDHRTRFDTHFRDFQPRFGLAYNAMKNLVFRAGYGISMLPANAWGLYGAAAVDQTGFSVATPFLATLGAGLQSYIPNLPGTGSFGVPFPNGFLQPTRDTAGLKTYVGQGVGYINPDYVVPRVHQFQFGLEYELPWKVLVEASYVGSRTRKFPVAKSLNYAPLDQQLKSLGDPNYWVQKVANPFYGAPELVGTSYNSPTLSNLSMATRYPQFSGVTVYGLPVGRTSFNSLESRFNKRLNHGLTLMASYTYSKTMSVISYRTSWATEPFRQIDSLDVPHHLTVAATWDLPVGRGKLLGKTWGNNVDRVLGGWHYNVTVEKSSGYPISMPGISVNDPLNPRPTDGRYFQTCTLLLNGTRYNCASATEPIYWRQANYNEITTYSTLWAQIRTPTRAISNMSILKSVPVTERIGLELRAEFFNAFNTPLYDGPNTSPTAQLFGRVLKDQWNFPRNIQFALRLHF